MGGTKSFLGWSAFTFSLIAIFILLSGESRGYAAKDREISVEGTCFRMTTPDRGSIIVTAEVEDDDLKAATRKATEEYERTREAVKRLGLENEELQTSEYTVAEVREWEKNMSVLKGFRARMGLKVTSSNIQRLGEVISIAAREGLKDVGNLRSFVSDEKLRKERSACLEDAARDARGKAEKLASALGAHVGEVLSISEGAAPEAVRPLPLPREEIMTSRASAPMAPPAVEPGKKEISLTIRATFALK